MTLNTLRSLRARSADIPNEPALEIGIQAYRLNGGNYELRSWTISIFDRFSFKTDSDYLVGIKLEAYMHIYRGQTRSATFIRNPNLCP